MAKKKRPNAALKRPKSGVIKPLSVANKSVALECPPSVGEMTITHARYLKVVNRRARKIDICVNRDGSRPQNVGSVRPSTTSIDFDLSSVLGNAKTYPVYFSYVLDQTTYTATLAFGYEKPTTDPKRVTYTVNAGGSISAPTYSNYP